jgi:hypothetical protein
MAQGKWPPNTFLGCRTRAQGQGLSRLALLSIRVERGEHFEAKHLATKVC